MSHPSDAYLAAEREMNVPPVAERGRTNQNPEGIGFWALVAEDFTTHERKLFEQGFWAIFVHRFGNWRMGQPKWIRAPATVLYRVLFKLVEWFCGISLWYTVKLGRRVRIWHHSGMSLGARAIGDDVQLRQNTTLGVARTGANADLPIVAAGADIGAGACVAGAVLVGRDAKIAANALVLTDVPDGATAMGNPAQVMGAPNPVAQEAAPRDAAPIAAPAPNLAERPLEDPRDMGVIALLGSANLDYLAMNMVEEAARQGLQIETYVPPFGQAQMELLKPAESAPIVQALTQEKPGATLIVERAEDLLGEVYHAPLSLAEDDVDAYLDEALQPLVQLIHASHSKLPGPLFVVRLFALEPSSLSQADAASARGLARLITRANDKIVAEAGKLADVHMLDGAGMVAEVGRAAARPGQYWHLGRVPFSPAFDAYLSRRVLGALLSLRGQSARILILDLDNTLWGGVLGEDGMEGVEIGGAYPGSAYRAFQEAIQALNQRGIALVVASKNDEDLALKMIGEHPEMVLRPENLVTHRIGWTEKALGIQEMLEEIGLGAANAMFIDDNPVEREKVRKNVPGCIVLPFPSAPEDLAGALLDSPFLDTLELTSSDLRRTAQYKVRAREVSAKRQFENVEDFYRDLDMRLTIEPFGPGNQKRVLQLFVKTNQFNSTLRRHDEAAVARILEEGGEVYAVGVSDRHSPYELMGVLVLRPDAMVKENYPDDPAVQFLTAEDTWWVDSFLLSCRILGRTVETAIVAWATQRVAELGAKALIGQVIEAPRNTPVRDVFERAGMTSVATNVDLGAGGLYRHDLTAGALPVPDYFTISDQAPVEAAPEKTSRPKAPKAPTRANGLSPAVPASVKTAAAPASAASDIQLDPALDVRLAQLFKAQFGLPLDADLDAASMDTLPQWDSLTHLRLAMEIDQNLGIRLEGARLGRIASYNDLRAAISQQV